MTNQLISIAACRTTETTRMQSLLFGVLFAALAMNAIHPTAAVAQVAWTQRTVSSPSPRNLHAMAYDSARGVTVMFGGNGPGGILGDTWEWDGTTWTQRMVSGPGAHVLHTMAYDSARGVTVLFGGHNGVAKVNDTWEWDGTTWTQRLVSGPSPRTYHAMAYDSIRGVTVLFGGDTSSSGPTNYNGETWEWNGTTWALRLLTHPSPRHGHSMAYHLALGGTLMFGGSDPITPTAQGLWFWNGDAWGGVPVSGPGPALRRDAAMAYDVMRGVGVHFGGNNVGGGVTFSDTWECSSSSWILRADGVPSRRNKTAMAYDSARAVTVLFGGRGPTSAGGTYYGDTWELGVPCNSPSVSGQPAPRSICQNGTAIFTVNVVGTDTFTYHWRRGTAPIDTVLNPTAATATLSLTNVSAIDADTYDCIVTNSCGSVTSNGAILTIFAVTPGDTNGDGLRDGNDIQEFVDVTLAGPIGDPSAPRCAADLDGNGSIEFSDLTLFVTQLLNG